MSGKRSSMVLQRLRVWRLLLIALGGLIVSAVDPFGVSTASQEASETAFLSILSPFSPPINARDRNRIVVLLITEDDVANLNWRAPLVGYNDFCALLTNLTFTEPRAVFLDMRFRPRQTDGWALTAKTVGDSTMEEKSGLLESACPPFEGPVGYRKFEKQLIAYNRTLAAQNSAPTGAPRLYLDFEPGDLLESDSARERLDRRSRVSLKVLQPPNTYLLNDAQNETLRPSPARSLYALHCADGGACNRSLADNRNAITLQWRRQGAPYAGAPPALARHNCRRDNGFFADFVQAARLFGIHLFANPQSQVGRSAYEHCPHIPYFTATEFSSHPNPDVIKYVRDSMKNAVIMVGFHYDVQPYDYVVSPTYGKIAGVFAHAAALDIMLQPGLGALRPTDNLGLLGEIDLSDMYEFAVVFVALLLAYRYKGEIEAFAERRPGRHRKLIQKALVAALILFCFVLIVLMISYFLLRLTPDGWASTFAIVLAAFTIMFGPRLFLSFATNKKDYVVPGVFATMAAIMGSKKAVKTIGRNAKTGKRKKKRKTKGGKS